MIKIQSVVIPYFHFTAFILFLGVGGWVFSYTIYIADAMLIDAVGIRNRIGFGKSERKKMKEDFISKIFEIFLIARVFLSL